MDRIVVGMIGGGFAARLHCENYRRVYGTEVLLKTAATADPPEAAKAFADEYGFSSCTNDYKEILKDPEIDVIDVITPPALHAEMIVNALNAGKHVITEKPLTGYFGEKTDGKAMYEAAEAEISKIEAAAKTSGKLLMYAENWVYAPCVQKSAEFLRNQKAKILYMHAEESHSGSHAYHAANWKFNGGGSLIRQGCHPITALLWLKSVEADARGEDISVKSVVCETGFSAGCLGEDERGHIESRPVDVEDIADLIITFTDGTKAHVTSADMLLGGMKNCIDIYLNNAVHRCKMNPNDAFTVYHADSCGLDNIYFTEKLGVKTGWQYVSMAEDVLRGYTGEFQDFIECVANGRKPMSGLSLAAETARVIYAGYRAAQEGRRIDL